MNQTARTLRRGGKRRRCGAVDGGKRPRLAARKARWYGRPRPRSRLTTDGIPDPWPARGARARSVARPRWRAAAMPARGAVAARQRVRLQRAPGRRAVGSDAPADGGEDRPGLCLPPAQGARRPPAGDRARIHAAGRHTGVRPRPLRAPAGASTKGEPAQRRADAARGARALARRGAGRHRLRAQPPGGDRTARGAALERARAADRRRPRVRPARGARRRAEGADRRAPAAGAPARSADAGALPVGAAGRGARRLPGGPEGASSSSASSTRSCSRIRASTCRRRGRRRRPASTGRS